MKLSISKKFGYDAFFSLVTRETTTFVIYPISIARLGSLVKTMFKSVVDKS